MPVFLAHLEEGKRLVVKAGSTVSKKFEGNESEGLTLCPLNAANAAALRGLFPFTAPVPIKEGKVSFGTGDRLGNAAPGHIHAVEKFDVFPILAQQSMRELGRTNRRPQDVIDAATFGVFQDFVIAG